MKFDMTLQKEYFDLIKSGKKQYEIRLYDEKRQQVSLKDTIIFSLQDKTESVSCVVIETLFAPNFKTLLNFLPIEKVGFNSVEQALKKYYEIYSVEQEKLYGVIAFKFKLKK